MLQADGFSGVTTATTLVLLLLLLFIPLFFIPLPLLVSVLTNCKCFHTATQPLCSTCLDPMPCPHHSQPFPSLPCPYPAGSLIIDNS